MKELEEFISIERPAMPSDEDLSGTKPEERDIVRLKLYSSAFQIKYIAANKRIPAAIAFSIKRLRVLDSFAESILLRVKSLVENDLVQFKVFKEMEIYKRYMPESEGGYYDDWTHSQANKVYFSGLDACSTALSDESMRAIRPETRTFVESPFPVLFAATLPWEMNYCSNSEINFTGPLMLGKDIPYLFVPSEKVDLLKDWIRLNVFGKKKPNVLAIEEFKRYAALGE